MRLPAALIAIPEAHYKARPIEMRAALAMVGDLTGLLRRLLNGSHSVVAGRLAGAYENIGREENAKNIVDTMQSAGYAVRVTDPFNDETPSFFASREVSPYLNRVKVMWETMRPPY